MAVGKRAMGVVCIVSVVLLWVGSSELIQFIFDGNKFKFESPLFLTFYSTSLFSVYLLGFVFCKSWRRSWSGGDHANEDVRAEAHYEQEEHGLLDQLRDGSDVGRRRGEGECDGSEAMSSAYHTWTLAAQFAPMWIAANLSFNSSLCRSCGTGTSVSSNTLLSSSSGVFTLIFSVLLVGEEFSLWKLFFVLLSMTGVSLLVLFDGTKQEGHNIWGDLMALAAAAFMGAYSVQLKQMLGKAGAPTVSMPMFFGFLGVSAVLLGLPIFVGVVFLGVNGWAHLELMHALSPNIMGALTFNGLVGTVLSDLLWAQAVLLTSPLAVNLSTCLTIPLAFLVDHLRGEISQAPQLLYVIGAAMVFSSFIGVNVLEYRASQSAAAAQLLLQHQLHAHDRGEVELHLEAAGQQHLSQQRPSNGFIRSLDDL